VADKLFLPETATRSPRSSKKPTKKAFCDDIGARTGTVGGAIPFGGYVVSMERLK
jgi:hypothetical protein